MCTNQSKYCFPKGPSVFIGRKKLLEYFKKGFFRYNLLVIDGMAGVGKTALALYFADLIDEDGDFEIFRKKLLWIQCEEGWRIESLLYELNFSLKELGDTSFDLYLRHNNAELHGILRALTSILNDGNYVVFIDDYHRIMSHESEMMLKVFGRFLKKSRVILISREKPPFSPLEWMEIFELTIDYLSKQESFLMIKTLLELHSSVALEQNILENIYRHTEGNPFLIKSFLSLLLSGDCTSEELLNNDSFSEDYILSQLIKDLSAGERDFLLSFSVYRQPVKREGLSLIYSEDDLDEIIDKLKGKFLIDLGSDKRYYLHNLLRDFCYERADKKNLHKICASYYIDLLNSHGNKLEAAKEAFYHYFKAEQYMEASQILERVMEQMISYFQLGELEQNIDNILKVTEDVSPFFFLARAELLRIHGKSREAVILLENKMEGLPPCEKNQFIILLARILSRLGVWDRALGLFDKSISISEELNDRLAAARVYSFIASIYRLKGEYLTALDYYKKSQSVNKDTGSEKLELSLRQSISITLSKIDNSGQTPDVLKDCLNHAAEMNWIDLKLSLTNNLAFAYYDIGKYDEALKLWNDNIELCRNFGWKEAIMHALMGSSLLFTELGEPQRAISQYSEALNISCAIEDNYFQCLILSRLGSLFIRQGELEKAADFIEKAFSIAGDYKFSKLILYIYLNFAEISFMKGEKDKVRDFLSKVLSSDSDFHLARAYRFKYILEADVNFSDRADEKLALLYGYRRRRTEQYFSWLDEVAFKMYPFSSERKYLVKMRDRQYEATLDEIDSLRQRKGEFDIFLDGVNGIIIEKEKGEIKIFKKKSLSDLLFFFVRNGGKFFSPRDLFPHVWKAKYVHSTDSPTVKMSISRLRKLIEPDPEEPAYVKLSPVRYKEERKYYFEDDNNFCFIEEVVNES